MNESDRPTKLRVPNVGIDDFEDAGIGMPPQDGMEEPMMGTEEPMMGGEDPMAQGGEELGGEAPIEGDDAQQGGENQELIDTINSLSIEDQAAVLKYAKSMQDNGEGQEQLPTNESLDDLTKKKSDRSVKRDDESINKNVKDRKNPFVGWKG